ncbi:MAG: hypothetical protein COU11_00500 [Candidatus Harrisonbacteria bacterium CG10_big_fil_rev_8_21_14_0_10_49_15]|uniref:TNase-like domain-containing protein n=1 Tax=Candidatus Harrisonbacteria bacterium CG10_big_fil_rev_8_21_14_0_10_49_15 TaxID=1974587 RepID=A0A2H0UM41_9BACT|nr:MAG: hypothetical protein COU11_00500 [Candidatus Harrisonbacteria bacterium CG10_big_fil_rev_8_21_14_0_10_49_15]
MDMNLWKNWLREYWPAGLLILLVMIAIELFFLLLAPSAPVLERAPEAPASRVEADENEGASGAEIKNKELLENFSGNDGQLEVVTVKRVVDGDTVELSDGRRVRYIGIDTAELSESSQPQRCYAQTATAKNRELVEGKEVSLERDVSDVDRYGRLLRYVYVGDTSVNDALVRRGYADVSTYPPDVKYVDKFLASERYARENNLGFWGSECFDAEASAPTSAVDAGGQCVIKGNITSEKIYHLPGCQSYDKTVIDESAGERWFCSESEATQAGWRKAKNC